MGRDGEKAASLKRKQVCILAKQGIVWKPLLWNSAEVRCSLNTSTATTCDDSAQDSGSLTWKQVQKQVGLEIVILD